MVSPKETKFFTIKIANFETRTIRIISNLTAQETDMDIEVFSEFAKTVYAAYKKFNYVFGRLKK